MSSEPASLDCFRPAGDASRFGPPPPARGPAAPAPASSWDWEGLYERLGTGLITLGRRRFDLSREDAEEALQRAATSILVAAPSVRSPEAYLTSVFLRECLGAWRRGQARQRRESPLPEDFERADDSCERIEVVCRFRRAFALLSPYCRTVMRSSLLEGKPRAASGDGSLTGAAIYKRYRKCLRTLTDALR